MKHEANELRGQVWPVKHEVKCPQKTYACVAVAVAVGHGSEWAIPRYNKLARAMARAMGVEQVTKKRASRYRHLLDHRRSGGPYSFAGPAMTDLTHLAFAPSCCLPSARAFLHSACPRLPRHDF